jgi:hypothetical protein
MLKRLLIAILFAAAFAYVESAVVVYLRVIFHPHGFTFPLAPFTDSELGRRMLMVEIGREAATLVLILTAAMLFARARQEATAYFLVIFAVWDIFYYVWLKVLIGWPASLMDWDILFLIPLPWASPVLYPVLVSMALFLFGVAILDRASRGRALPVRWSDWLGWATASIVLILAFCLAGAHMTEADYASHFHWPIYAVGLAVGVATFWRALARRGRHA